jgi:NAD(P)-dependent dehydrogenase (short-subunit alcohol dehydrogenase family)
MLDFSDYRGERVLVTGCSSGIGQATARALVALGAEVHGVDRKEPDTDLASFHVLDLADPDSISPAIGAIGGPVHALFNCAGATPMIPPGEILKVNFLGTRLLTERVLELMPTGGAVVSVSSDGGFAWRRSREVILEFLQSTTFAGGLAWYEAHGATVGHPYAFSKEALTVWTMQQSATLIQRGIRINTVSPGAVQTPMLEAIEAVFPREMIAATEHPSGRRSTPEEQTGPLLFLNSDAASYVNGADLPVDGGYWASLSLAGKLG